MLAALLLLLLLLLMMMMMVVVVVEWVVLGLLKRVEHCSSHTPQKSVTRARMSADRCSQEKQNVGHSTANPGSQGQSGVWFALSHSDGPSSAVWENHSFASASRKSFARMCSSAGA
ncbi:hypothetical protein K431DRAFT_287913 [Polychaeton citri CBS 116435]|uniref:Uncharacterized protein n=1 Tax=Polychaeton citri CBS 116435 TaxID=1314669 RepID=A0A9P4Q1S5_9PEZI|nr:hypothetical protein K431DRAFT_287913 [Polychaeton citri CBS 116435]